MAFRLSYKFVGFCVALALCGCTPYIYYPNAPNIPLPSNKHELKVGGGISLAGLYGDGSYAVDSHLIVLANYAGYDLATNYFGEVGAGYYYPVADWLRFDAIGGFGIGKVSNNVNKNELSIQRYPPKIHYQLNNDYNRAMLQADLGLFSKNFEVGFSFKITDVYMSSAFYEMDTVYHWGGKTKPEFTTIPYQSLFFEPAMFLNIGLKHVKLHFCGGGSNPIGAQTHFWNTSKLSIGCFFSEGIIVDLFQE